jgi:hypothetical protein
VRLRVRIRRYWRAREALVIELRERVGGRLRDRYAGHVSLGRGRRIPFMAMSRLAKQVVARLHHLNVDEHRVPELLRALGSRLFADAWHRENRFAQPVTEDVITFGTRVFAEVEAASPPRCRDVPST